MRNQVSRSLLAGILFLLVAFATPAAAEHMPAPTFDDLLRADYVAVGHFAEQDGAIRFVPERMLWGRSDGEDVAQAIRRHDSGALHVSIWGDHFGSMSGFYQGDAAQRAIWFFFKDSPRLLVSEPVELAPGYMALRAEKVPSQLFRLLLF